MTNKQKKQFDADNIFDAEYKNIIVDEINMKESIMRKIKDDPEIDKLAESIATVGLINPITVEYRDGMYYLVAGARRVVAHMRLGIKNISARIIEGTQEQLLRVQYIENMNREDVTIIEEARFIEHCKNTLHKTNKEIADLFIKSESYITKRIALLYMPEELQIAVTTKVISLNAAVLISKCGDSEQIKYLITYLDKQKMRDTELKQYVDQIIAMTVAQQFDGNVVSSEGFVNRYANTEPMINCDVCGNKVKFSTIKYVKVCDECAAAGQQQEEVIK